MKILPLAETEDGDDCEVAGEAEARGQREEYDKAELYGSLHRLHGGVVHVPLPLHLP